MSYGLLDRLAEYAGLSEMETQRIAQSQNWLHVILQKVEEGYSANPQNLSSMVKAIGFHVGAETVGARESAIIHQVIFSQQKDKGLGRFLRQHKLIFDGGQISPNYWVAVHGTEHSIGVEADHAEDAVKALNQVVQYTQATESQVIAWADEGFSHFNQTQLVFFQSLYTELQSKLQLQTALTVMK
ncbi:MAG: hypothetical protein HC879_00020 [Leptolyngbyaceae cyanobacterium SL_5_9]|nr:hypothetical protein [Leptolyngbyaceae cyanobacterium SL_5_9]NJO73407.1 hypothetical protein [Leptolyngbyaceae cyanobacterium RM1_406_9]